MNVAPPRGRGWSDLAAAGLPECWASMAVAVRLIRRRRRRCRTPSTGSANPGTGCELARRPRPRRRPGHRGGCREPRPQAVCVRRARCRRPRRRTRHQHLGPPGDQDRRANEVAGTGRRHALVEPTRTSFQWSRSYPGPTPEAVMTVHRLAYRTRQARGARRQRRSRVRWQPPTTRTMARGDLAGPDGVCDARTVDLVVRPPSGYGSLRWDRSRTPTSSASTHPGHPRGGTAGDQPRTRTVSAAARARRPGKSRSQDRPWPTALAPR